MVINITLSRKRLVIQFLKKCYIQTFKIKRAFVPVLDVSPSTFSVSSSSSSTLSSLRNVFHIKYPAGSKTKNKIRAFKDKNVDQRKIVIDDPS